MGTPQGDSERGGSNQGSPFARVPGGWESDRGPSASNGVGRGALSWAEIPKEERQVMKKDAWFKVQLQPSFFIRCLIEKQRVFSAK